MRSNPTRSLLLALMLVLSGCVYEPTYELICDTDDDCGSENTCVDGVCVVQADDEPDMPDTTPDMTAEPARIELAAPNGTEIPVGISAPLQATVFDAEDNEIDVELTWTSADEAVATVNGSGLVTGVAAGDTDITAAVGDVTATLAVTILAPVDAVEITIPKNPIGQGLTQQLTALALDANENELPNRDVSWSSSNTEVIEVDDQGRMTAVVVGTADITAEIEGKSATETVEVITNPVTSVTIGIDEDPVLMGENADVPMCLSVTLIALIEDGDENILDPRGRDYVWEVPAGGMSIAAISTLPPGDFNDHRRRATGNSVGESVDLTVTVDGMETDSITLDVVEYPVTTVEVTPPPETVPFGSTRDLEFTIDGAQPPMDRCIDMTWTSSQTDVARVDTDGVLSAVGPGATDVGLEVNGVAAADVTVDVALLLDNVTSGRAHSCGVSPDGVGICWGSNADGQLGVPAPPNDPSEPVAIASPTDFTAISAAGTFSCGLDGAGTAWCWGADGRTGGNGASDVPVEVAGHVFDAIEAQFDHACGIAGGGTELWCWGGGSFGRLGNGVVTDSPTPVQTDLAGAGVGGNVIDVAIGGGHTCIVTDQDEAWCWGNGSDGQLGHGDTPSRSLDPVQVDTAQAFVEIEAGRSHTCARTANNAVWCWGSTTDGILGIGDTVDPNASTPQDTGVMLTALSLGAAHACGIEAVTDAVQCWGAGTDFRLGTGDEMTQNTPVPVSGDLTGLSIAAGNDHTCAIDLNLQPYCWGSNTNERAGTNGADPIETPAPVWP